MKTVGIVFLVVVGLVLLTILGFALGIFGEAVEVAGEEFGPKAGLKKYEWFIEQASSIEKMDQDIKMFEARVEKVDEQYKIYGDDASKWQPHIQVQYNKEKQQAREDLIAVASQRNNLVKEYNAASEKFNWAPFKTPFKTKLDKPRERFQEYQVK